MSVYGNITEVKSGLDSIGDGLKNIAAALAGRESVTYNVIVNCPSNDPAEIERVVLAAIKQTQSRAKTPKNADAD